MAKMCILNNFSGSLPWIATMVTSAWAAYGFSSTKYYDKSAREQVAKIEKLGVEIPAVEFGEKDDDNIPTI